VATLGRARRILRLQLILNDQIASVYGHGGERETRGLHGRMRHEVIELAEGNSKQPVRVGVHVDGEWNTEENEEHVGDGQVEDVAVGDVVQLSIRQRYVNHQAVS
jgi:hypothetical protein